MSTDLTPMELIPVLDLQPLLDGDERGINAVSYTHLTLPTIYSV